MLSEASDERYDVILGDGTPIPVRELLAMLTGSRCIRLPGWCSTGTGWPGLYRHWLGRS